MSNTSNGVQPNSKNRLILISIGLTILTAVAGVILFVIFDRLTSQPPQSNLGAAAIVEGGESFNGITRIDPPQPVGDFTLTSQTTEPFSLSELSGKLVLVYFGYTHCPDICPLTLLEFKRVHDLLGDEADKVGFIFITVDGERDTAEALAQYLEVRNVADFVTALTGTEDDIRRIGDDYSLYFAKRTDTGSQANYLMDHTASTFLLNQNRELVRVYSFGTEATNIAEDLLQLVGAPG